MWEEKESSFQWIGSIFFCLYFLLCRWCDFLYLKKNKRFLSRSRSLACWWNCWRLENIFNSKWWCQWRRRRRWQRRVGCRRLTMKNETKSILFFSRLRVLRLVTAICDDSQMLWSMHSPYNSNFNKTKPMNLTNLLRMKMTTPNDSGKHSEQLFPEWIASKMEFIRFRFWRDFFFFFFRSMCFFVVVFRLSCSKSTKSIHDCRLSYYSFMRQRRQWRSGDAICLFLPEATHFPFISHHIFFSTSFVRSFSFHFPLLLSSSLHRVVHNFHMPDSSCALSFTLFRRLWLHVHFLSISIISIFLIFSSFFVVHLFVAWYSQVAHKNWIRFGLLSILNEMKRNLILSLGILIFHAEHFPIIFRFYSSIDFHCIVIKSW